MSSRERSKEAAIAFAVELRRADAEKVLQHLCVRLTGRFVSQQGERIALTGKFTWTYNKDRKREVVKLRKILALPVLLCLLCACTARSNPMVVDLDLYSDRGLAQKLDGIFADAAAYEGAFVRLTGQFYEQDGYAHLIRRGPDGEAVHLELLWDGEKPAQGQWVLTVGTLERYEEQGTFYLRVVAQQLYETGPGGTTLQVPEETFLTSLAELYENVQSCLGAQITISGRYEAVNERDGVSHRVVRTVHYLDGREAETGLELLLLNEPPSTGSWICVTGTLCSYLQEGERYLILADAVTKESPPGTDPVLEQTTEEKAP